MEEAGGLSFKKLPDLFKANSLEFRYLGQLQKFDQSLGRSVQKKCKTLGHIAQEGEGDENLDPSVQFSRQAVPLLWATSQTSQRSLLYRILLL
jgi:hypothetical protein